MKRFHGNDTFQRFPRASSDNPLRSTQSFYGPYTSERVQFRRGVVNALYWVGGVLLFLAMLKAPDIWAFLFGGLT